MSMNIILNWQPSFRISTISQLEYPYILVSTKTTFFSKIATKLKCSAFWLRWGKLLTNRDVATSLIKPKFQKLDDWFIKNSYKLLVFQDNKSITAHRSLDPSTFETLTFCSFFRWAFFFWSWGDSSKFIIQGFILVEAWT